MAVYLRSANGGPPTPRAGGQLWSPLPDRPARGPEHRCRRVRSCTEGGRLPQEHWISVPPHIATAREALAWSFEMSEAEYQPRRET
ncbi:DUF6745 domain-containing protein [Siccirubricoccus deserti]